MLALVSLVCSCATFEKNANSAMGAMDIAVTVARTVWEGFVVSGKATPDQIAKADLAFAAYQKAKKVFADAIWSYNQAQTVPNQSTVNATLDALNYAAVDVVDLIMLFVPDLQKKSLMPVKPLKHLHR